jgi:simple sugar transport system ATP-binding protein
MTLPNGTPLVEMRGISKAFGAIQALKDVDLQLFPGEILGLVGDNSAGKSTLMKILSGAYQRDSGDVQIEGQPTHFRNPQDSRGRGIEMIYQDFALCGNMDIASNMFLGRWPRRGLFVDRRRMEEEASVVLKKLKVDVTSVRLKVETLSGGRQQSVAIARAIVSDPTLLVCDEPTGDLDRTTAAEILMLLQMLNREHGKTIVMVTHDPHAAECAKRTMHLDNGLLTGAAA